MERTNLVLCELSLHLDMVDRSTAVLRDFTTPRTYIACRVHSRIVCLALPVEGGDRMVCATLGQSLQTKSGTHCEESMELYEAAPQLTERHQHVYAWVCNLLSEWRAR